MDEKMEKFLVDEIESTKVFIKKTLRDWDTFPKDRVPSNYNSLALDAETVAVHSILLGDKDEAVKWFRESSKYYYLSVESQRSKSGTCSWDGEMGDCKDALYMAVLSGDVVLIGECVIQTLGICEQFPKKHPLPGFKYPYLIAFAYCLQGKDDLALGILGKMRTENTLYGRSLVGLKEGLCGLIDGDKVGLVSGLNVLLDYHAKHVDSRMPYDLISIDATALIKVAREKGIIVEPRDIEKRNGRYVPWNLFE